MRPVRFVHAADLHLEAPFAGVEASEDGVRAALVASTFEAFERIVSLCIDEHVDFLLIAGDVYDNAKNFTAQMQFQKQAQRLLEADIPVFVVEGNHDPESSRPRDIGLPSNVRYFSTREVERIEVERDGEIVCTLYGRGYAKAAEAKNLAAGFKRQPEDVVAIGVLHTNVGGREDYEPYAPASMDDLRAAGMDYWALGHIHKPEVLSESPAIVYAGCPQGRSPKEDGPRGCYLVELSPGVAAIEFRPTASIVWERTEVPADGLATLDDVRGALGAACEAIRSASDGLPVIVRFELTGRSEAHGALIRGTNLSELQRDARDAALAGSPWIWIDRITDRTRAAFDVAELRRAQDFSGDLVRLVDEIAGDPVALEALVREITGPLEASLGALELDLSAEELLGRALDLCLDRVEGGDR